MVADKWTIMIVSAGIIVGISALIIMFNQAPTLQISPSQQGGFPHCLRTLQCANVPEFDQIPYEQLLIISKNYNRCFEDFKIEQTCIVQVSQDIERFHEMGFVTLR
ncbi:MAG: hypothetical protein F4Y18_00885 [Cenarchaeum sp. SB0663_bin_5]|nr:hypothetical protein [Cenarchaeum sp. SB0663_bin_5]MYH04726.1 hypothetical protein [Cenarchaeum sp. SB0675_bin_21]MYL11729.1 hypothetical protein [Cenarchaeum sp. SB0669_bin_11]